MGGGGGGVESKFSVQLRPKLNNDDKLFIYNSSLLLEWSYLRVMRVKLVFLKTFDCQL